MLSRIINGAAIALSLSLPTHAIAGGCVDDASAYGVNLVENGHSFNASTVASYVALIGKRDLYNSKGVRLQSFAAVLQQDRANLHKSRMPDRDGDFADQFDDYFLTPGYRSTFADAKYYAFCGQDPDYTKELEDDILNGRVKGLIWVVAFRLANGEVAFHISEVN